MRSPMVGWRRRKIETGEDEMMRGGKAILAVAVTFAITAASHAQGLRLEDPAAYRSFSLAPLHRAFLPPS